MTSNLVVGGAYALSFDKDNKLTVKDMDSIETGIHHEELDKRMAEINSFAEALRFAQEYGAQYFIVVNEFVVAYPAMEGTKLFVNNRPEQTTITLNKELDPKVALEIEYAKNPEDVMDILIEHGLVEKPVKDTERVEVNEELGTKDVELADGVDKEGYVVTDRYYRNTRNVGLDR